MPYKLNDILLSDYGIIPGRIKGEGIAVRGIWDLPKRIADVSHDWAEIDSVEPYVDVEDIALGGRSIFFKGILIGDKTTVTNNIDSLKAAIALFTDVVPIETPYGNACVYVKQITPKLYNGGATILIEYREPSIGAACIVSTPPTTYLSAEYSETADKNNCQEGYHGSTVQLTSVAGKFTSTVSQAAADLLAVNWVRENKQDYANANGTCIINPPVYYNVTTVGGLFKNDCPAGYTGSFVRYKVEPYSYSSIISQADANAQAQAEIDATLDQAYANLYGTCELDALSTFSHILNEITGQKRTQIYEIGTAIKEGSIFILVAYGIAKKHTATASDTAITIALALETLINSTTETQWNALEMAPLNGTVGFKPLANAVGNQIHLTINKQNEFLGTVDNG